MQRLILLTLVILLGAMSVSVKSQTKSVPPYEVSETTAQYLGKSKAISELVPEHGTSQETKKKNKRRKQGVENFKNRRNFSDAYYPHLEHLGADPLRQSFIPKSASEVEILTNEDGLFSDFGSPHDPSGDVGFDYYLQAINATEIGVYDKTTGAQVNRFFANRLWLEFDAFSLGDPIILFDEVAGRWYITEFTGPTDMLIAISETSDPLGSYYAYRFSAPEFPDYPKFAIWPNALVVTTNEGGPGILHHYFIDREKLLAADEDVTIQRVEIAGNVNTEAGFFVSTPVDWNGIITPSDDRPMSLVLNDSKWGGVSEDSYELYFFDIDFDEPSNTTIENLTLPATAAYDGYPCAVFGFGFECIEQRGGQVGLDAIPEVIMNLPYYRHYEDHESIVFNFVTDVTIGQNVAGIRWVELRKTPDSDWMIHQEGSFAPDDGLNRFMGSIAMDKAGNIGLAYNVSSDTSYVGMRFTGRYATDPLGMMTVQEGVVVDGQSPINSGGRFGDYAQMSIDPSNGRTFWYTGEYAGPNDSRTRIFSFDMTKDTFDLDVSQVLTPVSSADLTAQETLTVTFKNTGLAPISNYSVGYEFEGQKIEEQTIFDTLEPDSSYTHTFSQFLNMEDLGGYRIRTFITDDLDVNQFNDTLSTRIFHFPELEAAIGIAELGTACGNESELTLELTNNGVEDLRDAEIDVIIDGEVVERIDWSGRLARTQSEDIPINLGFLETGSYVFSFEIVSMNGDIDLDLSDNLVSTDFEVFAPDGSVTLTLLTDDFPDETEWAMTTLDGTEIATGGPYTQAGTVIEETICLERDSCYIFVIKDLFGDGICCGGGNGFYELADFDGVTIAVSEGEFGFGESTRFCVGLPCALDVEVDITNVSEQNADDGAILITATGGIEPLLYSIDGGDTFQDNGLFTDLVRDVYEILVVSDRDICRFEDIIILKVSDPVSTDDQGIANSELLASPNPSAGVYNIELKSDALAGQRDVIARVHNASGQWVRDAKLAKYDDAYKTQLSLVSEPSGLYYLSIRDHHVRQMLVLVKQ